MQNDLRQRIRQALDQQARARPQTCARCGGDNREYTQGCRTCRGRRIKRERRATA